MASLRETRRGRRRQRRGGVGPGGKSLGVCWGAGSQEQAGISVPCHATWWRGACLMGLEVLLWHASIDCRRHEGLTRHTAWHDPRGRFPCGSGCAGFRSGSDLPSFPERATLTLPIGCSTSTVLRTGGCRVVGCRVLVLILPSTTRRGIWFSRSDGGMLEGFPIATGTESSLS